MSRRLQLLDEIIAGMGYDPTELIRPNAKPVTAYKLFRTKPGDDQLYPLFVDADNGLRPSSRFIEAIAGDIANDKGQVKSKIGPLAYRPGWHAGDLPLATHIGGKSKPGLKAPDYRPDDQVWAEISMPNKVDWQRIANDRVEYTKAGKPISRTAHITDQIPYQGHYRYKTNPNMTGEWLIGGDMRVNRILEDAEVEDINARAGLADLPRLGKVGVAGAIGAGALAPSEDAEAAKYRVFRGEHGLLDGNPQEGFQTRFPALSFSDDADDANHYATHVNNRTLDKFAQQPRVYPAEVEINNPLFNNPDDPFVDFTDLEAALGYEGARDAFLRNEEFVTDTGPWQEGEFEGLLADLSPEDMRKQYSWAYPFGNDPDTVQAARERGYDGILHAGSGDGVGMEVRPFSAAQVKPKFGPAAITGGALGAGLMFDPQESYAAELLETGRLMNEDVEKYGGVRAPGSPLAHELGMMAGNLERSMFPHGLPLVPDMFLNYPGITRDLATEYAYEGVTGSLAAEGAMAALPYLRTGRQLMRRVVPAFSFLAREEDEQ